ncbi:hypothetical protein [Parabacteroides merdae]|uniref:hypothetical protein n=1 Tax=Parabacteroides merdae TaxID=46503 RepID=UPI0032C0B45A
MAGAVQGLPPVTGTCQRFNDRLPLRASGLTDAVQAPVFQQQFNLPFRHFREVLIVFHAPAHRHGVRLPMFQQTAEVSRSPVYPLPMHRLLPALQPSANPLRQSHGPNQ